MLIAILLIVLLVVASFICKDFFTFKRGKLQNYETDKIRQTIIDYFNKLDGKDSNKEDYYISTMTTLDILNTLIESHSHLRNFAALTNKELEKRISIMVEERLKSILDENYIVVEDLKKMTLKEIVEYLEYR